MRRMVAWAVLAAVLAGAGAAPSAPLGGLTLVVDPGHGGIDPGARGFGLREKEVNLDMARRVAALARSLGARVYLTRSADQDLGGTGPGRYRRDLAARARLARSGRAHLFLSLHANWARRRAPCGPSVFYADQGPVLTRLSERLAACVAARLAATSAGRCPVYRNHQWVLREAGVPAINVEVGFLSNPRDARRLRQAAYRAELARAVAQGVADFWGQRPWPGRDRAVAVESLAGPNGPAPHPARMG